MPLESTPLTDEGELSVTYAGDRDVSSVRHNKLHQLLRGRYRYAIALGVVLAALGGVAGFYKNDDVFTSVAEIHMQPKHSKILYSVESDFDHRRFDAYLDAQAKLIQSSKVLEKAAADNRWAPDFLGKTSEGLMLYLKDRLNVYHASRSEEIQISFSAGDPQIAQMGAQAVLDSYLQYYSERGTRSENEKLQKLYKYRQETYDKISRNQTEKKALIRDYGTLEEMGKSHVVLSDGLRVLIDELDALRRELEGHASVQGKEGEQASRAFLSRLAQANPIIADLLQQRDAVETQLNQYKSMGIGERHYSVRNAKASLKNINQKIDEQVANGMSVPGQPATPLGQWRFREKQLVEEIAQKKSEMLAVADKIRLVEQLDSENEGLQATLAQTDGRIEALGLEDIGGKITVINSGEFPLEPSNTSKRIQWAVLGGMFGGGCSFSLFIVIGLLNQKLRHADDVVSELENNRMLGILPSLPDELSDPEQAALAAHAVHHIRTLLQLQFAHLDQGCVLSVSGPAAGSGKTSLCVAMGLSFATSKSRTLLIDADFIAGGLTRRLNVVSHAPLKQILIREGMVEAKQLEHVSLSVDCDQTQWAPALVADGVLSQAQLDAALALQQRTDVGLLEACEAESFEGFAAKSEVDNLYVLPIGSAMPHHAGAISPDSLRKVIQMARDHFDVVLVDTGPVLGSLEASITATVADGVVLVVSRGDQRNLATQSLEHLKGLRAKVAGVVFNHALDEDMAKTSYATMSAAQSRLPEGHKPQLLLDDEHAHRYGPLATAVASYGKTKGTGEATGGHHSAA